jgi:glycosyltransferase involved in cell wall biosynthesis
MQVADREERRDVTAESEARQDGPSPAVAVLLPCFNEAATIGQVVNGFRAALPEATVYVYDNASTDDTSTVAAKAGAVVRREPLRGKGNVVRRMFADVEAEIYVMADGDGTYDAASAGRLVELLRRDGLDMVVGSRRGAEGAYPPGHQFGNTMISRTVSLLFQGTLTDILSGYRILSRRFVKSFPALSRGFDIETELTVHALELRLPAVEAETPYGARPEGSQSKLRRFHDGFLILGTILFLFKETKPFWSFGAIAAVLALFSLGLAYPLLTTYLETGLVPRFPTAILATGTMLLAFLSLASGLVLDSVCRGRLEAKRMRYLALGAPTMPAPPDLDSDR